MSTLLMLGCGFTLAFMGVASAMPNASPTDAPAPIVRVAGGCGPLYHRNAFGFCVANDYYGGYYRRLPPPCPPFYHRDSDPGRPICYPNV